MFYFFIICSSGFFCIRYEFGWNLARLGPFFFLVCVFLFCIFLLFHEIDYGVVCLYGAWSMEHYGILRGEMTDIGMPCMG